MNIFLGGERCSSRKNFAYSVRQSEYLSVKATGDHPVKNTGSTYYRNPIYKCHENSLWGLTCTPPVTGSSLPLEKASPLCASISLQKNPSSGEQNAVSSSHKQLSPAPLAFTYKSHICALAHLSCFTGV